MPSKLGYIVSRFPHLPETFILREIVELERLGWSISLYPLISQKQSVIHPDAVPWIHRIKKVSFWSPPVLLANLRVLIKKPRLYLNTFYKVVKYNISNLGMLSRAIILFPKAVWIAEQMKKEGIEHIHAHYATHPTLAAWIIHNLTGITYSITIHAHDIFVHHEMLSEKFDKAKFIVAISEFNREYIAQIVGEWVRPKTYVIHCGISPELYVPQQVHNPDQFKVISIGSLQPYKGQEFLIRACKRMDDAGIPVQCEILGEGFLHQNLEKLIVDLNLEEKVHLLGALPQEEVAKRLPQADCYVQPSVITSNGKMEGIPVALMEAMACALPVVASNISGIPELVIQGETGFIVPAADDIALANELIYVYTHFDNAHNIALAGREKVLKEFTLSSQIPLLIALYDSLV